MCTGVRLLDCGHRWPNWNALKTEIKMLKAVPKGFYSAYQYICTYKQVFLANAVRIQKNTNLPSVSKF